MDILYEYALLIAVALPVVVIAGMQVWLYLIGERHTMLLPSLGGYPEVKTAPAPAAPAVPTRVRQSVVATRGEFIEEAA